MSSEVVEKSRLRVAIAGCHRMITRRGGSHNWAAALADVPETEVVAVYDAGAETRDAFMAAWCGAGDSAEAAFWPNVEAYSDYSRMLAVVRPDVVCLATRQTQHALQCQQAIAAGVRGIVCDKPLVTSLAEMDRMMAACAGANVPIAFGLERRWNPRYQAAFQAVNGGAVGRLKSVLAFALPNLINHGCHWYDVALALAGDPEIEWVSGLVDSLEGEPPDSRKRQDPTGRATVGLANGAVIQVTPDGGPGLAFEVVGDAGRLLLMNDARDAYWWRVTDGSMAVQAPVWAHGQAASARPGGSATAPAIASDAPPRWETGPAAVRDLAQAVWQRSGGASYTTACDLAEARRATEMGFAIHASSRLRGATVRMAEVDRELSIPSYAWGNE